MEYEIQDGCMWEGGPWTIELDHECSGSGGGAPCKHCHTIKTETRTNAYGGKYLKLVWVCPRVVIARNEGGYNSTGVCLDCILEAAKINNLTKEKK